MIFTNSLSVDVTCLAIRVSYHFAHIDVQVVEQLIRLLMRNNEVFGITHRKKIEFGGSLTGKRIETVRVVVPV